jgi:hypothetical protein
MSVFRRITGLVLIISIIFAFSACALDVDGENADSKRNIQAAQGQEEVSASQDTAADEPAEHESYNDVTIDSTVLVDQDGLKITASELVKDPIWGVGIKVLIENDTDMNLGVQCKSLIVNNYMISDLFSSTVAAGKKANETIYLSSPGLEAAGIKTISDIVLSFHVFDGDSFEPLYDTEEIEIKTSAYGTVEQPALDDGTELVNQDGIRIIGKYVDEESFWGAAVLLFIENNSGENIMVQCDNMSINGYMVMPFFSSTVYDGRMALDEITIMSSDLEENNIEKIEEIELIFRIINPETFETILETDIVSFSVE